MMEEKKRIRGKERVGGWKERLREGEKERERVKRSVWDYKTKPDLTWPISDYSLLSHRPRNDRFKRATVFQISHFI